MHPSYPTPTQQQRLNIDPQTLSQLLMINARFLPAPEKFLGLLLRNSYLKMLASSYLREDQNSGFFFSCLFLFFVFRFHLEMDWVAFVWISYIWCVISVFASKIQFSKLCCGAVRCTGLRECSELCFLVLAFLPSDGSAVWSQQWTWPAKQRKAAEGGGPS